LERSLTSKLERVVIHEPASYEIYLSKLNQMDLCLSPFPYGNGNGNIDIFSLGIPFVALESDPVTGLQDRALIREAEAPLSGLALSVEDYCAKAIDLIDDQARRFEFEKEMQSVNLNKIFNNAEIGDGGLFGRLVFSLIESSDVKKVASGFSG